METENIKSIDEFIERERILEDENGIIHIMTKKLSEGGQGVVIRTEDPYILAKLQIREKKDNIKEKEIVFGEMEYKQFAKNMRKVRVLDIPQDFPIARPEILLKPNYCGYLMKMIEDMEPISKIADIGDNLKEGYFKTGGLRRRVMLFMKIARAFIYLQARGIVYADLSLGNVFISASHENSEIWLIDADNMRYGSDVSSCICTPGFGAPEVQKGSINTIYSDRFSFAILLYKILITGHPFIGKKVLEPEEEDEEDSWDEEEVDIYTRAYSGEFPWVGDSEDQSNKQVDGFDLSVAIPPKLMRVFQKTFGSEGIWNPKTRPDFNEWYEALKSAHAHTVECPQCHNTYYSNREGCPFCGEKRPTLHRIRISNEVPLAEVIFEDEGNESEKQKVVTEVGKAVFGTSLNPQYLYKYQTDAVVLEEELEKSIEFVFNRDDIEIKNLDEKKIVVDGKESEQGKRVVIEKGGRKSITVSKEILPKLWRKIEISWGEK